MVVGPNSSLAQSSKGTVQPLATSTDRARRAARATAATAPPRPPNGLPGDSAEGMEVSPPGAWRAVMADDRVRRREAVDVDEPVQARSRVNRAHTCGALRRPISM